MKAAFRNRFPLCLTCFSRCLFGLLCIFEQANTIFSNASSANRRLCIGPLVKQRERKTPSNGLFKVVPGWYTSAYTSVYYTVWEGNCTPVGIIVQSCTLYRPFAVRIAPCEVHNLNHSEPYESSSSRTLWTFWVKHCQDLNEFSTQNTLDRK